MPRRLTFLQQIRGRGNPVLLVDGGDCFFATPTKKAPSRGEEAKAMRTARTILTAYNHMGYDVLGLGPADLQFGVEVLKNLLKEADFPVVCANLVHGESGKPVFQDSVILEIGGVRYGIYGVLLSTVNRAYKRRVLAGGYEILDAVETTRKLVPELRQKCDVLIGLSHLNMEDNYEIVSSIPGIDVIVDPYSRYGNQPVWITEGEYCIVRDNVPILRIDGQGSRVGVFDMKIDPATRRYATYEAYDYPLEPQIFGHPEMKKLVSTTERGQKYTPPEDFDPRSLHILGDDFLGADCGACHEKQQKFWEKTKHQAAYASLANNQDHLRTECIECHTLAYGVAFESPPKVDRFKGVQCESCHGFVPLHPENPKRYGFGKVEEDTCWGCHNPQVTEKAFDFTEAREKTACPVMES